MRFLAGFLALLAFIFCASTSWASPADSNSLNLNVEMIDRSTPRRATAAFLEAAESRDYARAADGLDLHLLPQQERALRGQELAEMLHHVLDRATWIDASLLSDDPNGRPEDGPDTERIGTVRIGRSEVPITLTRLEDRPGHRTWVISSSTVAAIPRLYEEHGPEWLESRAPKSLRWKIGTLALWQWMGLGVSIVVAWLIGRFATFVLVRLLSSLTERTHAGWDNQLVVALRAPSRFFFGVSAMHVLLEPLALSAAGSHVISRLLGMILIAAVAWSVIRGITVLANLVEQRAKESVEEKARAEAAGPDDAPQSKVALQADLRVRGIATQVRVLRRVIHVAVGIVALALMLTQFEVVRSVGVSLLASAGLAGIVIGFAAQRTFGSLVAGIQLSVTQPIRIGDVVIIEKEFGTIEEVTLTYVVVRIWDERRLIVPMTRFLEHPFENWTKTSAELHGTVFILTDWALPIEKLRAEVDRVVTEHPFWDKRTKKVHVTDSRERVLEVRVLVSASNADRLFALRCAVREALVSWLQQHENGRYLPKVRVDEKIAALQMPEI